MKCVQKATEYSYYISGFRPGDFDNKLDLIDSVAKK